MAKFCVFIGEADVMPSGCALFDHCWDRRGYWGCPIVAAPLMRLWVRARGVYWRWAGGIGKPRPISVTEASRLLNNARHEAWKRGMVEGEPYWRDRVFADAYKAAVAELGEDRANRRYPSECRITPKPPVNPWIFLFPKAEHGASEKGAVIEASPPSFTGSEAEEENHD